MSQRGSVCQWDLQEVQRGESRRGLTPDEPPFFSKVEVSVVGGFDIFSGY